MYLNSAESRVEFAQQLAQEIKTLLKPLWCIEVIKEPSFSAWNWTTIIIQDFTFNIAGLKIYITSMSVNVNSDKTNFTIDLNDFTPGEIAVQLIDNIPYLSELRKSPLEIITDSSDAR